MNACLSMVLVAWLQQTPPDPATPPPAAAKYEFPTAITPGESRLIEIRTTSNSTMRMEIAGKVEESKSREESTTSLVDTLLDPTTQPKDHVWSGRRRIVKAQATKDGIVDDPEVNGFEANVWVDTTNHIHLESASERVLTQSKLEELLLAVEAFGLGPSIRLQRTAAVGDEFELPFATLAPWCLSTECKTPAATARLRFDSVDPKKNVARFKGPVHVEEAFERSAEQLDGPMGMKGTGAYDGTVSIDYDVPAHRVARIVCRAKADFRGETVGALVSKVSGTSVIETTITCSVGTPAASALNEKTQFRDVPHEVGKAGVAIALPSHFVKFSIKQPDCTAFRSLLHGKDAVVTVVILPLVLPGRSLKEAGKEASNEIVKVGSTVKGATASGSLGAADACEYSLQGTHGLNAVFQLEPGRFVVVQCACPEAAWAERSKEFPKYFQALKKLTTKN